MNKKIIFFLFIFLTILFSSSVLGVGFCELDKEIYHTGENGALNCFCTAPQERFQDGYIIFQNSSHILSSVAINSGDCVNSFFGANYVFSSEHMYDGNATFSLNADGSGSPTNWGDILDVRTDFFNVSGAALTDCLIEEIKINVGSPGSFGSAEWEVLDGITNSPIVNARCNFEAENVDDIPLLFFPQNNIDWMMTQSSGETGLSDILPNILTPSTTYLFKIHCFCPDNGSDKPCYLSTNGEKTSFKACKSTFLDSTFSDDYRNLALLEDSNLNPIIFGFVVLIIYFGLVAFVSFKISDTDVNTMPFWLGVISIALTLIELMILVGCIYFNQAGANILNIVKINFWFVGSIGAFIGVLSVLYMLITLFYIKGNQDKDQKFIEKKF